MATKKKSKIKNSSKKPLENGLNLLAEQNNLKRINELNDHVNELLEEIGDLETKILELREQNAALVQQTITKTNPTPKPSLLGDFDLPPEIQEVLKELVELFRSKNNEYRSTERWDANFTDSAPVANGLMSPLLYCMILAAKQDDAFWKTVNRSSGQLSDLRHRLSDGAVYRIIALTILNERMNPNAPLPS